MTLRTGVETCRLLRSELVHKRCDQRQFFESERWFFKLGLTIRKFIAKDTCTLPISATVL